jgi:hypothetical protein
MKRCTKCKVLKDDIEFSKLKHGKKGLQSWCKSCMVKSNKRWREKNPEKNRDQKKRWRERHPDYMPAYQKNYHLVTTYGITIEEYVSMYNNRDGHCDICTDWFESLVVDHDHETGEVRGLLCFKCNLAIGMLDDNIGNLHRAIDYLKGKEENE